MSSDRRYQSAPYLKHTVSFLLAQQYSDSATEPNSAQYHWSVMVLSELNFTSQLDDEDDATVALLVPVIQAQHMASALAIADLVHRQCIHWGVNHIPTSFLQPINAAIPVITGDL